ncbi:hypothetical protein CMV30_18820 [Nibricoccus aquaticus]|uniref:DUF4886 domain-containing protein n=1 Tax=Nibricoccus aquaticus TaxID=2576891 RepID=A0A290QAV5_9BACT|nr:DUF4886 domain-containing protein [Nibricoccus aquaticus]ATC65835.1 hypothetical protein CMV30_18820 [Nibricoccus aquaticus]
MISSAHSPRFSSWLRWLVLLAALTTAAATAFGETVRILSIGNSFSENSLRHLPALAATQGVEIIVGEANMPGASLKRHASHWRAAQLNADDAEGKPYRDRRNPSAPPQSLAERLQADTWDYVTIQQFSQESFRPETYEPWAGEIVAAIRRYAPQARILVHQTWAYRDDHPWFAAKMPEASSPSLHATQSGEFLTPATMHAGLRAAYDELAARYGFTVVPVGDAFHLARQMPLWQVQFPDPSFDYKNPPADARPNEPGSLFVGWLWRKAPNAPAATFTLDATHANVAGEYLGACVFFETLTGRDVLSVTWHPAPLTDEQAASLRTAAHAAARPSLSPNSSSTPAPAGAPAAPRSELEQSTDRASSIGFSLRAGESGAPTHGRLQGRRIELLHLKDDTEIGLGTMDFAPIFKAVDTIGALRWQVVEIERYNHDPMESARHSLEKIREWDRV